MRFTIPIEKNPTTFYFKLNTPRKNESETFEKFSNRTRLLPLSRRTITRKRNPNSQVHGWDYNKPESSFPRSFLGPDRSQCVHRPKCVQICGADWYFWFSCYKKVVLIQKSERMHVLRTLRLAFREFAHFGFFFFGGKKNETCEWHSKTRAKVQNAYCQFVNCL